MLSSWLGIALMAAVIAVGLIISFVRAKDSREKKTDLVAFAVMLVVFLAFVVVIINMSMKELLPVFIIASVLLPVLTYYLAARIFTKSAQVEQEIASLDTTLKERQKAAAQAQLVLEAEVGVVPQEAEMTSGAEGARRAPAQVAEAKRKAVTEKETEPQKTEATALSHKAKEVRRQAAELATRKKAAKAGVKRRTEEAAQKVALARNSIEEAQQKEKAEKQATESLRAEKTSRAEDVRLAEQARNQAAFEVARKVEEVRKADEARKIEESRRQAEQARQAAEAEQTRQAAEAEQTRQAAEAEQTRQAEQARQAAEAEQQTIFQAAVAESQENQFFDKAEGFKAKGMHAMAARLYLESANKSTDEGFSNKARFEAPSSYIKASDISAARELILELSERLESLSPLQVKKLEAILKMI